jgi:putative membrane protein
MQVYQEVKMKLSGWTAIGCAALLTVACDRTDRNDRRDDSTASITNNESADLDDHSTVGTSGAPGEAETFATHAMMANKAEVKLGELARQRAQSADVKQFAEMMVNDHTKGLNDLKKAVNGKVPEPTELDEKHRALHDRLAKLSGADFDREYMKAMVDGHREVKDMVAARAGTTPAAQGTSGRASDDAQVDQGTRQWATKALPTVTQHLQKAEQIVANMK